MCVGLYEFSLKLLRCSAVSNLLYSYYYFSNFSYSKVLNGATTLRNMESLGNRSGKVDGELRIVKCGVLPALADSLGANSPDTEELDETGRRADRLMK